MALISELLTVTAGQPFWIGLHFKMAPEWHIYWKNSGDSGLPPRIIWSLPEGFAADEIEWPMPQRLISDDLATYVYDDEVLLPVKIYPPKQLDRDSVTIAAKVDWLACREACIPGSAELSLKLRVSAEANSGPTAAIFQKYKKALPKPLPTGDIHYSVRDSLMEIQFPTALFPERPARLYFYPDMPFIIQHAASQALKVYEQSVILSIPLNPYGALPDSVISGVLEMTHKNGQTETFLLRKIKNLKN